MTYVDIHDYNHEVECIYKENKYSVRDNGAVMRHSRIGKPQRPLDNKWTFGNPYDKRGYMYFASKVPIHRIVATAFHGKAPSKQHVVDHIDTNRRNNRQENLRWLTRLENILLNPITVERIIFWCGSIEAFLENPSILGDNNISPNFSWMRTVTPEEAKTCKSRMLSWVQSDKCYSGGSLGDWVFSLARKPTSESMANTPSQSLSKQADIKKIIPRIMPDYYGYKKGSCEPNINRYQNHFDDLVASVTPGAAQRKWRTPSEFPCCPEEKGEEPIRAYLKKLVPGMVFSHNQYSTSLILKSAFIDTNQSILVMSEKAETGEIKPWTLAQVTYENGLYVHEGLGSFFEKKGAYKHFCLEQGIEWQDGDVLDDFC